MGNRPNDMELERLRDEMSAAQEDMDRIKAQMNALTEKRNTIREEVGGVKTRLTQLKQNIDREYDAMRAGFAQHDVQGANRHKRVAESLKQQLDAEYKKKDLCYEKLGAAKAGFESALEEMCVCDLSELIGVSQSAVSHQLRSLKLSRLVKYRREGKSIFYSLDDDHVRSILAEGMAHIEE